MIAKTPSLSPLLLRQIAGTILILLVYAVLAVVWLRLGPEAYRTIGLALISIMGAAGLLFLPLSGRRLELSLVFSSILLFIGGNTLALKLGIGEAEALQTHMEPWLWVGIITTALANGALAAIRSRRLGFGELLLSTLLAALFFFLQGQFDLVAKIAPEQHLRSTFLASVLQQGPGVIYLGRGWLRIFGLAWLVSLVMVIFSSSLFHVLYGTRSRQSYEKLVGLRYLLSRRRQGWVNSTAFISVLGVGLGVASLIAVTGLMSGYQRDVTERILNSNAHLIVQKYGTDFSEHPEIAQKCLKVPGVLAASPFIFNEAMVSTDNGLQAVMLKGIDPQKIKKVTNIANQLIDGASLELLLPKERGGVHPLPGLLVGQEFLDSLQVGVGDVVSLTTPVGITRVQGNTPRRMNFVIAGVFKSGVYEFDQKLVYADLTAAQQFMGLGQTVTGIELKVQDAERVEAVAPKVIDRIGGYPYRSLDWREMNAGIFTALKIQKLVMFLVLIFIIIVAAFNIASTLFMVVVEKTSEIALLKALGASDASIMKIFMVVGWVIGLVGTTCGVIFGIAIAYLLAGIHFQLSSQVYLVDSLSVLLKPLEITATALAALVICHLATIFPSLQAAAVRPAVSLRSE